MTNKRRSAVWNDIAGITRRELWLGALLSAASCAQGRAFARPVAAPITADSTLVHADASDIHADQ